jgi:hypothetical protein
MLDKPHAMPAAACALRRAPALPMEEPLDAPRDDPQSFNGSGWRVTSPTSLSSTPSTRSPSFPTPAAPTRSRPRHVIRSGRVRLARRRSADQHFQKGSHHDQIAAGRDSQPDQDHIAVAVGVLGTDIVLLTLGITGLASPDPELIRAGSLAMGHSRTPSCSRRR